MRRQGSGTYVGQGRLGALDEGLEKLVSYSELARRRGVRLEVAELRDRASGRWARELGRLFDLDPTRPPRRSSACS